jgi:hypothetical protein
MEAYLLPSHVLPPGPMVFDQLEHDAGPEPLGEARTVPGGHPDLVPVVEPSREVALQPFEPVALERVALCRCELCPYGMFAGVFRLDVSERPIVGVPADPAQGMAIEPFIE